MRVIWIIVQTVAQGSIMVAPHLQGLGCLSCVDGQPRFLGQAIDGLSCVGCPAFLGSGGG